MTGEQTGQRELADSLFGAEVKMFTIHQSIKTYLNNQRQGTHSTLTRSEVSGGGVKPWRQKGTGRARAGTNTSPLWEGGGIIFGPKPRDYTTKVTKKVRRSAIKSALTLKAKDDKVLVVDSLSLDKPQTKAIVAMLDQMQIAGNKILFLHSGIDRNLELSCRNVKRLIFKRAALTNAYDILWADYVLLTQTGLQECEEVFGK